MAIKPDLFKAYTVPLKVLITQTKDLLLFNRILRINMKLSSLTMESSDPAEAGYRRVSPLPRYGVFADIFDLKLSLSMNLKNNRALWMMLPFLIRDSYTIISCMGKSKMLPNK